MLSFSISDTEDLATWCSELAAILKERNIKATIFLPGKIADENPEVLAYFGEGIDIGSQTYNYVDLISISDFTVQLEEERNGKKAVDNAGNLYSRVFRAPYGATDENIYYLLSQCEIIADFSYEQQYNLFQNGQFIKYNAITYEGSIDSAESILNNTRSSDLKIITFYNSQSISQIVDVISRLKNSEVQFVSASDLAEADLTGRGASSGF